MTETWVTRGYWLSLFLSWPNSIILLILILVFIFNKLRLSVFWAWYFFFFLSKKMHLCSAKITLFQMFNFMRKLCGEVTYSLCVIHHLNLNSSHFRSIRRSHYRTIRWLRDVITYVFVNLKIFLNLVPLCNIASVIKLYMVYVSR